MSLLGTCKSIGRGRGKRMIKAFQFSIVKAEIYLNLKR